MRRKDVPQDKSDLANAGFRELCYATDENGNYVTENSTGWEVKTAALDNAIERIKERTNAAKERYRMRESSPIEYYMELNKMEPAILASYVGMWGWRVKRHLKYHVFKRLNERTLQRYADAFNITLAELKDPKFEG